MGGKNPFDGEECWATMYHGFGVRECVFRHLQLQLVMANGRQGSWSLADFPDFRSGVVTSFFQDVGTITFSRLGLKTTSGALAPQGEAGAVLHSAKRQRQRRISGAFRAESFAIYQLKSK
ncbi:hypothetical protein DQ04_13251030 [Trypanosoma grayi]|uniref:hypothetical protein n=1 Tax=Trypanosoma grayi TaxID=71804 RepID=UPI0004F4071C|nr:hypothetical protein DQ04_13251030 [Trypanosoma grayi]KEG06583.1 hypothetical protein DQ04_13251030 [Trypanosoma grayi]